MSQNVTEGEAIHSDRAAEVSRGRSTPKRWRKARTEVEWQVNRAISGTTGGRQHQYCLALRRQVGVKPRGTSAKGPNRYLAMRCIERPASYP
jgi:hypothetical protein